MADDLALKSLLSGNDRLPYGTLSNLAGAPSATDQDAQNLSDIASGVQPNSILSALFKGATTGVAMSKKEKAQAQRDAMNAHIQDLANWDIENKKHQQEMEDLVQSHVYAQANQGAFVDGLTSVMNGGDPQPVIDVMKSDPSMARTVARQFGVDASSQLVDLQVTKDRNGQDHLIGSFADAQGKRFTAPTQIEAAKVLGAVAKPVLDQRAADAARQSLADRAILAGIKKDEAAAANDLADAARGPVQSQPKPLPPSALKIQNDELTTLGSVSSVNADIQKIIDQIDKGELHTGLLDKGKAFVRNNTGNSTPQTRNLATLTSNLEGIRNGVLLLNKGVQTEGDAQRAMDQIINNTNDTELVKKRLQELMITNQRAADLRKSNIDVLRSNYGHEPLDYARFTSLPAAVVPPTTSGTPDTTPSTPIAQTLPGPDLNAIDAELRKRGAIK